MNPPIPDTSKHTPDMYQHTEDQYIDGHHPEHPGEMSAGDHVALKTGTELSPPPKATDKEKGPHPHDIAEYLHTQSAEARMPMTMERM